MTVDYQAQHREARKTIFFSFVSLLCMLVILLMIYRETQPKLSKDKYISCVQRAAQMAQGNATIFNRLIYVECKPIQEAYREIDAEIERYQRENN